MADLPYCIDLSGFERVIYFHGWCGFGVNLALISRLQEVIYNKFPKLRHHRLIYIDCSDWKSRRSLQKKIAEELKLDHTVINMLDKQDEDDDFNGVDEASREEIRHVTVKIYETMVKFNFIMVFLNGSGVDLDLTNFGIPLSLPFDNIVIWSFKRRFLTIQKDNLHSRLKYVHRFVRVEEEQTIREYIPFIRPPLGELTVVQPLFEKKRFLKPHRAMSTSQICDLLRGEAASIAARHPSIQGIDLTTITNCCLYEMFLYCSFHSATGFAWAAHSSNFWICDEIIKGDQTKEICNALYSEIKWECDVSLLAGMYQDIMQNDPKTPFVGIKDGDTVNKKKTAYRWISLLTSKILKVQDMANESATSLFLAFERPTNSAGPVGLPDGLFKHCCNLGVLVLFCCAFNFAAPPFLRCRRLRFLGLERCTNNTTMEEGEADCTVWEYLYNLWVLDLRHTDWHEILSEEKIGLMANLKELNIEGFMCWKYISDQLQRKLPYLEKLRIIKPSTVQQQQAKITPDNNTCSNAFSDKTKLEVLDLSGNTDMKELPTSISSASQLRVLLLDGCNELENVDNLPSSLTSFSLDGYGPASRWTSALELPPEGFRHPKNPSDQDNKVVKISRISLQGCKQLNNLFLRGLPFLTELNLSGTSLKVLDFESMVVDIRTLKRLFLLGCQHLRAVKWGNIRASLELLCIDTRPGAWTHPSPAYQHGTLQLQVVVVDVRLMRSVERIFRGHYGVRRFDVHVVGPSSSVNGKANQHEVEPTWIPASQLQYADVLAESALPMMQTFPEPPAKRLDGHVEIQSGGHILESELENSYAGLSSLMKDDTGSLHIHDVSINASMPRGHWMGTLTWCRVERCPSLEGPLFHRESSGFNKLEVIWVSELAKAHCLWPFDMEWSFNSFKHLRHLHLHSCPRLQYALPLPPPPLVYYSGLRNLETIHVVRCDLKHIFVLAAEHEEDIASEGFEFPSLTTIHLYDLQLLRDICEVKMFAPKLQTIRIRGCFNLRRLPATVEKGARGMRLPRPTVEVEKDVWDKLEWDGVDSGHHPSCYEPPMHSRHYRRRRLLRGTVLR